MYMYLIKNQSTTQKFLVYHVRLSVYFYRKKNIIFYSIEYFVVYIDVNLKLKLEIITQQLLTITLTMHLINVISIKALGLSFIGAWS